MTAAQRDARKRAAMEAARSHGLVVIDPDSSEDLQRFHRAAVNHIEGDWTTQEAARSLNPFPRPECPAFAGALIRTADNALWVRTAGALGGRHPLDCNDWVQLDQGAGGVVRSSHSVVIRKRYSEIEDVVEVLRTGRPS